MDKTSITAILIGVFALIMGIVAVTQGDSAITNEESTFQKIVESGKATFCYIPWPPSLNKDPNTGELSGFIVDVVKRINEDLNVEVNYVESTWGGFPADLNSEKCDAVMAGVYPTIGRSTSIAFTKPFGYVGNGVVIRKDETRITSINDFKNFNGKIAVIQGEFGHLYAQKNFPNADLLVLDKSADLTAPLLAVATGQADAGFSVSDTINSFLIEQPDLRELNNGQPYTTTPISFAVRQQDQEMLNFLNNALDYLEVTGELDGIIGDYDSEWFRIEKKYVRFNEKK